MFPFHGEVSRMSVPIVLAKTRIPYRNRCLVMTSSCQRGDSELKRAEKPQTLTMRLWWRSGCAPGTPAANRRRSGHGASGRRVLERGEVVHVVHERTAAERVALAVALALPLERIIGDEALLAVEAPTEGVLLAGGHLLHDPAAVDAGLEVEGRFGEEERFEMALHSAVGCPAIYGTGQASRKRSSITTCDWTMPECLFALTP